MITVTKQSLGYQIYAFYYTFLQYFSTNKQCASSPWQIWTTSAYYTNQLNFSRDFPLKVGVRIIQCVYYNHIFTAGKITNVSWSWQTTVCVRQTVPCMQHSDSEGGSPNVQHAITSCEVDEFKHEKQFTQQVIKRKIVEKNKCYSTIW